MIDNIWTLIFEFLPKLTTRCLVSPHQLKTLCHLHFIFAHLDLISWKQVYLWSSPKGKKQINPLRAVRHGIAAGPVRTVAAPVSCTAATYWSICGNRPKTPSPALPWPDGQCGSSAGVLQPHKETSVSILFALGPFHHEAIGMRRKHSRVVEGTARFTNLWKCFHGARGALLELLWDRQPCVCDGGSTQTISPSVRFLLPNCNHAILASFIINRLLWPSPSNIFPRRQNKPAHEGRKRGGEEDMQL